MSSRIHYGLFDVKHFNSISSFVNIRIFFTPYALLHCLLITVVQESAYFSTRMQCNSIKRTTNNTEVNTWCLTIRYEICQQTFNFYIKLVYIGPYRDTSCIIHSLAQESPTQIFSTKYQHCFYDILSFNYRISMDFNKPTLS